jgi:hypothetical protein
MRDVVGQKRRGGAALQLVPRRSWL